MIQYNKRDGKGLMEVQVQCGWVSYAPKVNVTTQDAIKENCAVICQLCLCSLDRADN